MERKIPRKNYIIYGVIVIVTIAVVLYLNSWYKAYKQNELENSYISKYIHEINYEEFKNFSVENPNLIVYVGKTNCEECVKLEKELYKIIDDNELKDNTVFLNVTDLSSITTLEKEFNKEGLDIKFNIPSIAILKNSEFTDILNSSDENNIKSDLIIQLLEEYEYIK